MSGRRSSTGCTEPLRSRRCQESGCSGRQLGRPEGNTKGHVSEFCRILVTRKKTNLLKSFLVIFKVKKDIIYSVSVFTSILLFEIRTDCGGVDTDIHFVIWNQKVLG